ncbi:MAG: BatD family protein, partial [Alistipes sp.]|nr:BatD family protein [Alistipes sp.]
VIEVRGESESSSKGATTIAKDDLMLRLELSKTSAYKGEPIRATLKLYTRINFAVQEYPKMPAFNGFWSQQLNVNQGPFRETLNNKAYDVYNITEYILYPQQGGELAIEPIEMTAVALIQVESNKSFDPFFGGGYETMQIPRKSRR